MQGKLASIGKRLAPSLSSVFPSRLLESIEIYLEIMQGKGSGTGWDIEGELIAEARVISCQIPLVVNVGANMGQWAGKFWNRFPTSQMILIEPSHTCFELLRPTWESRGAVILNVALSSSNGKGTLFSDLGGSGAASLYKRHESYFGDMTAVQQSVDVLTLDSVMNSLGSPVVDLLKMDCEGSELEVLRGAKQTLSRNHVRAISFEFGSANIYSHVFFREIWDLLVIQNGFQLFRIRPGGRVVSVTKYSETLEHFRGATNYLAKRDSNNQVMPE